MSAARAFTRQLAAIAGLSLATAVQAAPVSFTSDPITYDQRVACEAVGGCASNPESRNVVLSGVLDIPDPLSDFSGTAVPSSGSARLDNVALVFDTPGVFDLTFSYIAPTTPGETGELVITDFFFSKVEDLGLIFTFGATPDDVLVQGPTALGRGILNYQRSSDAPVTATTDAAFTGPVQPVPVPAPAVLLAAALGLGVAIGRRRAHP